MNKKFDKYNNFEISNMPQNEWIEFRKKYKNLLLNEYPNYNFDHRFKLMLDIKKVLDSENVELLLADGVLLGAVREQDFIQWDPDVDMHVMSSQFIPAYNSIRDKLLDLGYIVRSTSEYPKMKINLFSKGEKVGILAIYKGSDYYYRSIYRWPLEIYDNLEKINFREVQFSAPKIQQYLLHQYGADWHSPKKENYFNKELFTYERK